MVCKNEELYEGYDLIDGQEQMRLFSSALFVIDCNYYDNKKGTYTCFLLTAYP
jgi:hypothetical protein